MASLKLPLIFCFLFIFSIWGVVADGTSHQHHAAAAPAPSVDCSNLILNMADCLSFVSNGSTTTKPEGSCCSGLKTVLKADAECLCEAFKSSANLGVVLNVTKALSLPAACKLHAPSVSNCGLSMAPAGAPGGYSATAPTLTPDGENLLAPAPSPGASSDSHGLSIPVGSLITCLLVALFSSFLAAI